MIHKAKFKIDYTILIPIILLAIISIITISSAEALLGSSADNYMFKQIIWYIVGFGIAFIIFFIGNKHIYNDIWILYIIGVILLALLLFFAPTINNAKCWFVIPKIGAFQPSEFMKIILIITLASMISKFRETYNDPSIKEEFVFLLKVGIVVLIPSLLTFLEPDTGVVLIYLLITLVMLFISGIRFRWFGIMFAVIAFVLALILVIYFTNTDLFIKMFGTSFFLRVDRILDWSSGSGYQLENGLTAIGSGGLLGFGMHNTPIYFPEPQTDFIFAVFASNFGFIGSISLIALLLYLDIRLIRLALECNDNINKYIISGIVGMLIYQQFQNIGMTFGLMPITGITLPFISYGGSSLISYMIVLGLVLSIAKENTKYRNVQKKYY